MQGNCKRRRGPRRDTDAIMHRLMAMTEQPQAQFMRLHDRHDPLWGDCRHSLPLRHELAKHLDDVRRDYLYRKAHDLPLEDAPPPTLPQAVAALATLPDPRIAQVIRACCFSPTGKPLSKPEQVTEQDVAAQLGVSQKTVNNLKRRGLEQLEAWCCHNDPLPACD